MEREAIHSFLSEESVLRHKSYLRQLELEYSVLLASEAGLNGKCAAEIALMRILNSFSLFNPGYPAGHCQTSALKLEASPQLCGIRRSGQFYKSNIITSSTHQKHYNL